MVLAKPSPPNSALAFKGEHLFGDNHNQLLFSRIDEIGPDIAEQVDADGRIDRDKWSVFSDNFGPVCVRARTHLYAGTHVAEVIQFS